MRRVWAILSGHTSVRDDTGERHILQVAAWKDMPAASNPRSWRTVESARDILRGSQMERAVLFFLSYVVLVVVVVIWCPPSSFGNSQSRMSRAVTTALMYLVAGGVATILPIWRGRVRTHRAVSLLRRRSLCPVCAYDLRNIPTADDGLTTCPECGAAWRLALSTAEEPDGG